MAKKKPSKKDIFFDTNKTIDTLLDSQDKRLSKEFILVLGRIKKTLADAHEKFGSDGILTREEMVKFGRLSKLETQIVEQIQQLTKLQVQITKDSIQNTYQESYYRYGYLIENEIGLPIYSVLPKSEIDQILYSETNPIKWDERVKAHNQNLANQIKEEVSAGLMQGVGYAVVAVAVAERMTIGLNRAKKINRNEIRRVQEEANLNTMQEAKKSGVIAKKQWVSTMDGRTRDTHRHLDGTTVEVDEYFYSRSGKKAQAPHKFGVHKEDINCRCTMISVIEIDGERIGGKERRARSNGDNEQGVIINYKTYDEWKEGLGER